MTLSSSLTTSSGTILPSSSGTLSYNALYSEPSSLIRIAGSWISSIGTVFAINSDGSFSGTDPSTGCISSGRYSIIDANYNAYAFSATYQNCPAAYASLNGLTSTGLFTLDDTVNPITLRGGVSMKLPNGAVFVAVYRITHT
jgi:hypothetical protein